MAMLFAAIFSTLSSPLLNADDRPNIMVFLVDDMGLMDTSAPMLTDENGQPKVHKLNTFYKTPSMNRLSEIGIRFSDFHAHSVCSPTRISIMTGQNAARHRSTNFIGGGNTRGAYGPKDWNYQGLNKQSVTLPRLLQQAGYHTIHIGKGHFGPKGSEGADPLNLGFDENVAGHHWGAPGSYNGEDGYGKIKGNKNKAVPHLDKYHGSNTHLSEALTIEAKKKIEQAVEKKKPFFLYMSHYAVHSPFQVDPRFAGNYDVMDQRKLAYATLIEGMDKSLGELMDHFEKLNIADNTLIIFLGDNGSDAPIGHQDGIAVSAPLRGKKGSKWEGGTRVPFIAGWGRLADTKWQKKLPIKVKGMQGQMGFCFDLLPTITKLVDVKVPNNHKLDGQDLSLLFSGQADDSRSKTFISHFPHSHRSTYFTSYREDNWKLIYHYPVPKKTPKGKKADKKKAVEVKDKRTHQLTTFKYALFNLADDPSESNNLATSQPEKLASMVKNMVKELDEMDALYPEVDGKPTHVQMP